jgi:broad specificity phosphatase PhoE
MQKTEKTPDNRVLTLPTHLSMPARLVFVRHGESQANLINRAMKKGIISDYPKGFSEIPDREIRLSPLGVAQAKLTGPWLSREYPDGFDVIYVSDHARAQETAGHLCLSAKWSDAQIRVDPLLGERNWGRFTSKDEAMRAEIMRLRMIDPLHAPMPDGETLLETRHRCRELLDRVTREFSGKRVLVISHGEYIEAIWSEILHLNTERQKEFFHSSAGDIKNCQVVEFSSCDPASGELSSRLRWVRSSCPQANLYRKWEHLNRKKFTPTELLREAERYPTLDVKAFER